MARRRFAIPDEELESDQPTTDRLLVFRRVRPVVPNQYQALEVPPIMPMEEEQQAAAVGLGPSSTATVDNTVKSGKWR